MLRLDGRTDDALAIVRRCLEIQPFHEVCWVQLVITLTMTGELDEAREAAHRATGLGVALDEGMLDLLRGLREGHEDTN